MIVIVATLLLLTTTGCALANMIVNAPTPTPEPARALRPTFTPTAVNPDKAPKEPVQPQPIGVAVAPPANGNAPALVATEPPLRELPTLALPAEPAAPSAPAEESQPVEQAPQPQKAVAIAQADGVGVHAGPGADFAEVGTLRQGDQYEIVAKAGGEVWWQICCLDGQPVWVFGELVSVQGPAEAVAQVESPAAPTAVPTPEPTATATATPEPKPFVVVTNPRVNVRQGPGTDFALIDQVTQGTRLEVIGRDEAGAWWQVCCVADQEGWIVDELVRTEGPIDQVALAEGLPTATPQPSPTPPAATAAAAATEPPAEPDELALELTETSTFPFGNNDYFRVAVKVTDPSNNPLGGYYLRVRNETTGQEWLSRQSGDYAWEYSAPNSGFGDFREINVQFDTNGKSPLTGNSFAVWLVDGGGSQVGATVRHEPTGGDFEWLYIVYTLP